MDESFVCRITGEVMKDPVIDPEGNSYERSAIISWLQRSATSPVTRTPLSPSDLVPNRALREAIESHNSGQSTEPQIHEENVVETQSMESIEIERRICTDSEKQRLLITLIPPNDGIRTPTDVCCVVDVSGSMGGDATIKDAAGQSESFGLNLLDIVKHAVKTVIHTLNRNDRLSVVVFSSRARILFDLIFMNEEGKDKAEIAVEALSEGGMTNLWDGLRCGMDLLKSNQRPGALQCILLLTDGVPNSPPPRGHIPTLQRYKKKHGLSCSINTFGFGYSLDSELLNELAIEGDGMNTFIPDSSFVGTAFVNCTSNILATAARNVEVRMKWKDDVYIKPLCKSYVVKEGEKDVVVYPGPMQFGQQKDILLSIKGNGSVDMELKYYQPYSKKIEVRKDEIVLDNVVENSIECDYHGFRLKLSDLLNGKCESMHNYLHDELIPEVKGWEGLESSEKVKDLLADLEGQVTLALSRDDWFSRWGRHYLPSLGRAHLLQQCNNFKDPGIQHYGGNLFQELRDDADDIFCRLPAPKPHYSSYYEGSVAANVAVNMSRFNDRDAPCFSGDCDVMMSDSSEKKVMDVVKGDVVKVDNELGNAKVVCVVKTLVESHSVDVVHLDGGLCVTPWHPVWIDGKWCFPSSLKEKEEVCVNNLYDFVLDSGHVVYVNGIKCVTFGHELSGDVVGHPYFGSSRIIEDLKKMPGWETGSIELRTNCQVRDPKTGLVIALKHE